MDIRWIYGLYALINIDTLRTVRVLDAGAWMEGEYTLGDSYCLAVYYKNLDSCLAIIDKFEKECDALTARDWFMILLCGRIDIPDWNEGRTDTMFRKRFRDR